jgi:hypothetical protein
MNAMLSTTNPLPSILDQSAFAGRGRRHRIDTYFLTSPDIERFNQFLQRLGRRQAPLDRDQVVTAARQLCECSNPAAEPPSIRERMRLVETAANMISDPDWQPVNDVVDTARMVIEYARGSDNLIPDWVPQVGRLDDAIVVDAAWPRLSEEIESYLDFCRVREAQAELADGSTGAREFTRADWEQYCYEEAALCAHQRAVREHSYLPDSAALFRIH